MMLDSFGLTQSTGNLNNNHIYKLFYFTFWNYSICLCCLHKRRTITITRKYHKYSGLAWYQCFYLSAECQRCWWVWKSTRIILFFQINFVYYLFCQYFKSSLLCHFYKLLNSRIAIIFSNITQTKNSTICCWYCCHFRPSKRVFYHRYKSQRLEIIRWYCSEQCGIFCFVWESCGGYSVSNLSNYFQILFSNFWNVIMWQYQLGQLTVTIILLISIFLTLE